MTITINAQGSERRRLVQCISQWLSCEPNYLGAPSFAYQVDYLTIEKSGSLTFDDATDSEVIERLLQHIYDEGFDIDQSHTIDAEETILALSESGGRWNPCSMQYGLWSAEGRMKGLRPSISERMPALGAAMCWHRMSGP